MTVAVKKPLRHIADRADPQKAYVMSPNGLVGEIVTRHVIAGLPITIKWEHGGHSRLETRTFHDHPSFKRAQAKAKALQNFGRLV